MKKLFAVLAAGLVSLPAFAQTFPSPTFNSLTLQNPLAISSGGTGAATQAAALAGLLGSSTVPVANGGTGSSTSTGSGSVVLSTSPMLTTPNLGTPSAATLTNAIGLPVSTGISGLGTGVATALSAAATGSGGAVLSTSPSIAAPTVTGAFNATGLVTNGDLASAPANTTKCNPTTSASSPTNCAENASNPLDFGAVANSSGAAATNVTAFQNAMAASPVFHCPDGQTFYVGSITIPTTVHRIYGACTLIATGTITSGLGVLEADSNSGGLVIDGPIITASIATYPSNSGVRLSGSSNFDVRNVNVTAAGNGILVNAGSNFTIESSTVGSFGTRGIYVLGASSFGHIANNYVNGQSLSGSSHCISVAQGTNYTITGNHALNCVGFGISVASVPSSQGLLEYFTVANNVMMGTHIECINVENGALGAVTGNTCYFNSNSTDFGMSFYGAVGTSPQETANDISVTGNTLYNPCKSGIALADAAFRINVAANYIYSPNQCAGSSGDYQSGVLLYGGAATSNSVTNNFIVDTGGHMAWQIGEGTYSDGSGTPSANFLEGVAGTVGTSGQIDALGSGTQVINTSNMWNTFTPVLTCQTGTPGTQAATGRYKQIGKTVVVEITATLTTVGTCASSIYVSIPVAAQSSGGTLAGRESQNTGGALIGMLSSTTAQIFNYSGAVIIAAGDVYHLNGSYESQ